MMLGDLREGFGAKSVVMGGDGLLAGLRRSAFLRMQRAGFIWRHELVQPGYGKILLARYWSCAASFFIAAFSRITSPVS